METFLHLFDSIPTWALVSTSCLILAVVALRALAARGQRIFERKSRIVGYRHTLWVDTIDQSRPVVVITKFPIPSFDMNGDKLTLTASDDSLVIIRPSKISLADINNPIYGIPNE